MDLLISITVVSNLDTYAELRGTSLNFQKILAHSYLEKQPNHRF